MQPVSSASKYLNSWSRRSGVASLRKLPVHLHARVWVGVKNMPMTAARKNLDKQPLHIMVGRQKGNERLVLKQ